MTHRGEVFWASLPEAGPKPVLVVCRDPVARLMRPIVVRITSRERHRELPTDVALEAGTGGLRVRSWALCHEIFTLRRELLADDATGSLPPWKMREIDEALAYALDLDALHRA